MTKFKYSVFGCGISQMDKTYPLLDDMKLAQCDSFTKALALIYPTVKSIRDEYVDTPQTISACDEITARLQLLEDKLKDNLRFIEFTVRGTEFNNLIDMFECQYKHYDECIHEVVCVAMRLTDLEFECECGCGCVDIGKILKLFADSESD